MSVAARPLHSWRTVAATRPILRAWPALLTLLAVAALAPPTAHAWSSDGHRIVGLVAEQHLDGDVRRELFRIAGGEGLDEIGLYLDRERDRLRREIPGSDRWHYDNRPVCDPGTPFGAKCAQGDCPTAAFERFLKVLGDRGASREDRLFALRVVVHVLGDVHQPLHAGDNRDRGGNDINVDMGPQREPRTLHGLWDREFVDRAARGRSDRQFARELSREYRRDLRRIQAGDLEDWMQESYDASRTFAYSRVPSFACGRSPPFVVRLPDDYRDEAARIVRQRLGYAGLRLAGVLNRTLGD